MRYLMTVMGNADYEAGKPASPPLYAAMGDFMAESMKAGAMISAGGLRPSSAGARLTARDGQIKVLDGPFSESKEVVGGYAFVEAPSKAAAIEIAIKFVEVHFKGGVNDVDVEIREVAGGPGAGT